MVDSTTYSALNFPYGSYGASLDERVASIQTRFRTRSWSRTSGFRSKQRWKGELPMNPYTDRILTRKVGISSVTMFRPDIPSFPPTTFYGCLGFLDVGQYSLPMTEHSVLSNKALGKIPSRINGSKFNLPLFFLEFGKTRQMVTNLAQDIYRKFKSTSTRRQAHNIWLEYRYGWRLLMKDIYDGLCAIHDLRQNRNIMSVSATATSSYTWEQELSALQMTRFMVGGITNKARARFTGTYETRYTVRFRESLSGIGTLQQFGITNPIALAWEIIPYSFVIDWLVPVSDYLSSLDTWVGKDFVSGTISYVYHQEIRCTPHSISNPQNPALVIKSTPSLVDSVTSQRFFKRERLTSFPSMSPPQVQLSLNLSRMIDAISLLRQRR